MNIILACPVLSDAATLTGSSVAAGLPLGNLKTMPIRHPARFTSPSGAFLMVDLGEESEIDLIALLGHNASVDGEVRVRAAGTENDVLSSPDYDSGTLRLRSNLEAPSYTDIGSLDRNHFILKLDSSVSQRYWRIDFEDAALAYIDIGRLYLSKVFQPSVNVDYGQAQGFIDPSTVSRVVSGRPIPNERPKRRMVQCTMSFGSEDEMYGAAFDIDTWRGTTKDVLYIHDYDNKALLQKRSVYGLMTELSPVINSYFQLFEKNYRIEEIAA